MAESPAKIKRMELPDDQHHVGAISTLANTQRKERGSDPEAAVIAAAETRRRLGADDAPAEKPSADDTDEVFADDARLSIHRQCRQCFLHEGFEAVERFLQGRVVAAQQLRVSLKLARIQVNGVPVPEEVAEPK